MHSDCGQLAFVVESALEQMADVAPHADLSPFKRTTTIACKLVALAPTPAPDVDGALERLEHLIHEREQVHERPRACWRAVGHDCNGVGSPPHCLVS